MTAPAMSPWGRAYVLTIVTVGAAALSHALGSLYPNQPPGGYLWMVLAALTFFSGPFCIKVPSVHATISVSESFVFASVLLFGWEAAVITIALDGLIVSLWARRPNFYRTLFNIAEPATSIWVAAHLFYFLIDGGPLYQREIDFLQIPLPLLVLTTVYFVLNSVIISLAIYFERGVPPSQFLRSHLPQLSVNFFSSISLAVLVLVIQGTDNATLAVAGVIVPLLIMSYVSSKTSVARFEDANRHLAELNKLYLSTVETLAMAIDAKDQITHGHIRRVQVQAVALAGKLGVTEEKETKAIEAAALLHDLGKLAVPEHILNKPGKLTPAEFEQMKQHAGIGADILSRISFPYPVTPIVRHHHENWDGTGYPDRISGDAIPLGARILSVVDCFDALTSDRPYRRALTTQAAIDILIERRGNMYDPAVVDGFIALLACMPAESMAAASGVNELASVVSVAAAPAGEVPGYVPQALEVPVACAAVEDDADAGDAVAVAGRRIAFALRALSPDLVTMLSLYEPADDAVVVRYVSSKVHGAANGIRIPLGERLTGWVAANQRVILNSDPALDLGDELASAGGRRLGSCLCVPIPADRGLLGVLTIYTSGVRAFTDQHVALVQLLLPEVARLLLPEAGSAAPAAVGEQGDRRRHMLIAGGLDAPIELRPKRARSVRRRKMAVATLPSDAPAKTA